jgi:hypothetical protein
VAAILDTQPGLRSISNLQKSLPNTGDDSIYTHLKRWTREGPLGWVFDNARDTIDLQKANIIGFDYTELIDNDQVRPPVISYLLHRLESLIDGRRLIYVMDEFWKILDGAQELTDFAKNKQKTIRKQNGLGIFATQSPEDALSSDIASALIEQTATMVLLPNPNASRQDYIEGLKLTEAEYKIVAALDERSRRFLIRQGHDSNVCRLDLNGMDDALAVISASTDNIEILHQILDERAAVEGVDINDLRPEQWLQDFYDRRKGSGKDPGKIRQTAMARAQGVPRARQPQTQAARRAPVDRNDEESGSGRTPPLSAPRPAPAPIPAHSPRDQQGNDMNFKQAAAAVALAATAAAAPALGGCEQKDYSHVQFRQNPHPVEKYEIIVKVENAPGPFRVASGSADFQIANVPIHEEACLPPGDPYTGAPAPVPDQSGTDIELHPAGPQTWTATVYADAMLDARYFDRGVCKWDFNGFSPLLMATGAKGEIRYSPFISGENIRRQKTAVTYFWRKSYPGSGYNNFLNIGVIDRSTYDSTVTDADLFTITLSSRKLTP